MDVTFLFALKTSNKKGQAEKACPKIRLIIDILLRMQEDFPLRKKQKLQSLRCTR